MTEGLHNDYEPPTQRSDRAVIRVTLKTILSGVIILGLLWGLYSLRVILLLLLLSLLLSYLLEPIVRVFDSGQLRLGHLRLPLPRLPRLLTIFLVYLFGLAVITALSLIFLPIALKEGSSLIQNVPTYVNFIQERTAHVATLYHRYNLPTAWQPVVNSGLAKGAQALLTILQTILGELTNALTNVWWLLIPPLMAFFLLKDSGRVWDGFLALVPQPAQRQRAAELLSAIEEVLATFIRTQLALCVLMGLWIIGLLTFLGIPYGFLLGLLAGVLEFVPVFGPLAAGALITLVAVFRDPLLALWVVLALTLLRVIQDYIVVPRVMGQHIHLHPAVIIVAVLCGAELAGTVGVFLATPVAAIIRVMLVTWQRSRASAPSSYEDDVSHPLPHSSRLD